jgi:hypothetical protein
MAANHATKIAAGQSPMVSASLSTNTYDHHELPAGAATAFQYQDEMSGQLRPPSPRNCSQTRSASRGLRAEKQLKSYPSLLTSMGSGWTW